MCKYVYVIFISSLLTAASYAGKLGLNTVLV